MDPMIGMLMLVAGLFTDNAAKIAEEEEKVTKSRFLHLTAILIYCSALILCLLTLVHKI